MKRGISLIEILVAISIAGILGAISISVFSRLSNATSLDRDANIVLSHITKARTLAIDSVNSLTHGINFGSTTVKVFSGTVLTTSNIESIYTLQGGSRISAISLSNATTSLYFNKLTGNPSATGNITVSQGSNSKTIIIYATGIAEIQ